MTSSLLRMSRKSLATMRAWRDHPDRSQSRVRCSKPNSSSYHVHAPPSQKTACIGDSEAMIAGGRAEKNMRVNTISHFIWRRKLPRTHASMCKVSTVDDKACASEMTLSQAACANARPIHKKPEHHKQHLHDNIHLCIEH